MIPLPIVAIVYAKPEQARVCDALLQERANQDAKWGEQNHPDGTGEYYRKISDAIRKRVDAKAAAGTTTWVGILLEEVFEAAAESDPQKLRAELIQSAAVISAWVEAIDRRPANG